MSQKTLGCLLVEHPSLSVYHPCSLNCWSLPSSLLFELLVTASQTLRRLAEECLSAAHIQEKVNGDKSAAHIQEKVSGDNSAAHIQEKVNGDKSAAHIQEKVSGDNSAAHIQEKVNGDNSAAHIQEKVNGDKSAAHIQEKVNGDCFCECCLHCDYVRWFIHTSLLISVRVTVGPRTCVSGDIYFCMSEYM